jgi:hypothetical protein
LNQVSFGFQRVSLLAYQHNTNTPVSQEVRSGQAANATTCSFALALAHAAGVNSLIWVILAAGKRVNKSFK